MTPVNVPPSRRRQVEVQRAPTRVQHKKQGVCGGQDYDEYPHPPVQTV